MHKYERKIRCERCGQKFGTNWRPFKDTLGNEIDPLIEKLNEHKKKEHPEVMCQNCNSIMFHTKFGWFCLREMCNLNNPLWYKYKSMLSTRGRGQRYLNQPIR